MFKRRDKVGKILGIISFNAMRYYMLIIIGYIVLYPLFYMVSAAIKSRKALLDVSFAWIPKFITGDNFKTAFDAMNFFPALSRTLTLQIISALIEVFICAVIAYGFARFNFKGKNIAMTLLILSLLIPVPMYSMSLSVNYRQLDVLGIFGLFDAITGIDLRPNIYNTNWTLWLPSIFGVGIRSGMIIYIYIQFFSGLPYELEDAAYVDGAGPIRTFFSIALPSSSVVIVTASVLSVIWHWNETHLSSLCFLNDTAPLSVVMFNFQKTLESMGMYLSSNPIAPSIVFSACLMFMAIPLVLYLILQRKFVKSIDRVGITG